MNAEIYEIIKDEEALINFINWLPDCAPVEQYYVSLFARKKYCVNPAVKHDKAQLRRFTSTKERLIGKIRQLECRVGAYCGENELPIPQEALALYMSPNPRDLQKSVIKGIKVFADMIDSNWIACPNPRQEIMTVIQKTKSRTHFHIFDIDSKDENNLTKAMNFVDGFCTVIETRGGYHLLVHQSHVENGFFIEKRDWYFKLKEMSDVSGDALIPVVGCVQGDFVPRFKYLNGKFI